MQRVQRIKRRASRSLWGNARWACKGWNARIYGLKTEQNALQRTIKMGIESDFCKDAHMKS